MRFEKFMAMMNEGKIRCGKVRYASQPEAARALQSVRDSRTARGIPQQGGKVECRYYECDSCNGFHLTSSKLPKPREEVIDVTDHSRVSVSHSV